MREIVVTTTKSLSALKGNKKTRERKNEAREMKKKGDKCAFFYLVLSVFKSQYQKPNKLEISRKSEKQIFTCFVRIFSGSIIVTESENPFLTSQVKKRIRNALLSGKKVFTIRKIEHVHI